jgi:ribonuclease Z
MRPQFLPRLVNEAFEDPGLFVPFQFQRRAILFDLGDNHRLTARDLLKVSHVFVTHTHMDHFIGFDRLLRCLLGRERNLYVFGPAGFLSQAEGKLAGYSWDLVDGFRTELVLHLAEMHPGRLVTRSYRCRERFRPGPETVVQPFSGRLAVEPAFEVAAVILEHSIPCLGFALTERFHVNILATGLDALGLEPGPWLTRFKQALYDGGDPGADFEIEATGGAGGKRFPIGELAARIARVTAGQKIVYITDVGDTPANRETIVAFARNADHLFIEAAFLHSERETAAAKHHLTARQAGEIAGLAAARLATFFHFSPRYEGREEALRAEAAQAYAHTLARAPAGAGGCGNTPAPHGA